MEQLTKNQAVATSQEAVQNQNEPQLRDENAHNDKSVHGVLNPTYQAGLRRDAVQPDIEAERKKRDEIEAVVNIQTACLIMEGAEFTENIINGVERPVKAAELFAFTLRVRAGNTDVLTDAEENVRQKLRAE